MPSHPLADTSRPQSLTRHAFAVPELLTLFLILALLFAVLALAAHDSRRRSRQGGSIDNLRFFGSATQSYAADNAGRFWSYSWTAGAQSTEYPDLNFASDNWRATVHQAVFLIRTTGEMPQFNPVQGWAPQVQMNHLPLLQHMDLPLISRHAVSPEDGQRLAWQRGADAFLQSDPRPAGSPPFALRWIFSSTYETGSAFWCADAAVIVNGMIQSTLTQADQHGVYNIPSNMNFGRRRLDEVRFPASKAHMWDRYQRDLGGRVPFFAVQDARVPVLCVDGSAGLRAAASTNFGFNPATPMSDSPTSFAYQPDAWEPPTTTGASYQLVVGRMRWTRWGLRGRDFNGPEATGP